MDLPLSVDLPLSASEGIAQSPSPVCWGQHPGMGWDPIPRVLEGRSLGWKVEAWVFLCFSPLPLSSRIARVVEEILHPNVQNAE